MMPRHDVHRRGANAIEFALALPFVLLMLTASTDFAMWSFARQAVSRAVQDGAREASRLTLPADATDGSLIETTAENTVLDALTTWGLDAAGSTVNANWAADVDGRMWLTVSAVVPYQSFFGLQSIMNRPVSRTFVLYTQEQNPPSP